MKKDIQLSRVEKTIYIMNRPRLVPNWLAMAPYDNDFCTVSSKLKIILEDIYALRNKNISHEGVINQINSCIYAETTLKT